MSKRNRRPKPADVDRGPEFKFIEFNRIRHGRGAEAARVAVNGQWLWMSERDVDRNIETFGRDAALLKAKMAYATAGPPLGLTAVPTQSRTPTPAERLSLAEFIAEQTGRPCDPDDIVAVRRVKLQSEAERPSGESEVAQ
jgi:hypothetical protein